MSTLVWWLPCELWVEVFRFLSLSDRLRVRLVCQDFRELVDSSTLWTNWSVRLGTDDCVYYEASEEGVCEYNEGFWNTLRRRRVTSAVLTSRRHWTTFASELPQLNTLIINFIYGEMPSFHCFTNLQRLHVKRPKHLSFVNLLLLLPPRLTHLSVCGVEHGKHNRRCRVEASDFHKAKHLTNLTSLVCHYFTTFDAGFLPALLSAFPRLTDLSVCCKYRIHPATEASAEVSVRHQSLTSLELFDSALTLPNNVMKMMPSLRSLALIFCRNYDVREFLQIRSWLKDLPALSSLVVENGLPVREFVESISSSVSSFTLNPEWIDSADMTELSKQLPNLLHLHLDPTVCLGSDMALIPLLFPGLHSLRIRLRDVPEEIFLSLAELKKLRILEILESMPFPDELLKKLRDLTQNRVWICHKANLTLKGCKLCNHSVFLDNFGKSGKSVHVNV